MSHMNTSWRIIPLHQLLITSMWAMSHVRMSHVTLMNEQRHICMSHVTHMNTSWLTKECVKTVLLLKIDNSTWNVHIRVVPSRNSPRNQIWFWMVDGDEIDSKCVTSCFRHRTSRSNFLITLPCFEKVWFESSWKSSHFPGTVTNMTVSSIVTSLS